jgi:hypothetical protein
VWGRESERRWEGEGDGGGGGGRGRIGCAEKRKKGSTSLSATTWKILDKKDIIRDFGKLELCFNHMFK